MTVPGILAPGVTILDVCDAISRCVGDAFDAGGARLNGIVIRDGERVLLTFDFGGHVMAEGDVINLDVVIRGEPG